MSSNGYEDLIDYEDDHEVPNGAAESNGADGEEKKNFFGIHSTGFRYEKNRKFLSLLRSRLSIIGTFC
jgi:hypothetical protein